MNTIKNLSLWLSTCLVAFACHQAPAPADDVSEKVVSVNQSPLDVDGDGVDDSLDNCVGTINPAPQINTDGDALGDACDPDIDNDGALNANDNCQMTPNLDQANLDGDAMGDLCDPDMDGDGDLNGSDNCQTVWNPLQLDLDGDLNGDACDGDCDDDGLDNFLPGDNTSIQDCRQQFQDNDGDGFLGGVDCRDDNVSIHPGAPDLCDGIDNNCDGVVDENLVNCVPFPLPDGDGDGIANVNDNCPEVINENQHDADGDLIGDACDPFPEIIVVECNVDFDCGNIALVCVDHFCVDAPPPPPPECMLDQDCAQNEICENTVCVAGPPSPINCQTFLDCPQGQFCNGGGLCEACLQDDTDCDGILNPVDSCPNVRDSGVDTDNDGMGDACDDCPNFIAGRNQCGQCANQPVEICDGVDNNCDGTIDEGFGLGVACNNGQQGECARSGTIVCGAGVATCSVVPVMPGIEVCNGLDDDCNGTVDNGVLNACGVCGAVPVEVCDNLDNDCDGSIDEGVLNACGGCGPVGEEVCDGFDNDCDQLVDEGLLNACGQCGAVPVEICDNIDNDCDGTIDEGVKNACNQCGAVPAEVCDTVDNDCDGSIDEGVKNACNTCGPVPQEICNGQDDDCNGVVDNGVLNACGQCGAVPVEICDNIDNDCDGTIDDGVKNACGACGAVPAEVCQDNVDNDCDGQTDEGCDDDTDGVQDQLDNCPDDWNPAQGDRNENSIGNVCDRPDCEVTLLTENGKFFEYNQSSVNNVDPDENPAAPWITRTAGTREICVRRGEVALFTATDANAGAYALTSTPICDENQITENAGYFISPNRPNDFAQYCTKICAFGPDWRCRVPAN